MCDSKDYIQTAKVVGDGFGRGTTVLAIMLSELIDGKAKITRITISGKFYINGHDQEQFCSELGEVVRKFRI